MSKLREIFCLEFKRFTGKKYLILWVIVLAITIFFVDKGINEFKNQPLKEQKFKEIHDEYFKSIRNYADYVDYGIKMLFSPSPCSILYRNTTVPPDLTAKVDSITTVKIHNNLKGKSLSSGLNLGKIDFSRIVLFLITLMALWYGYESLQHREFLMSLAGSWSNGKLYCSLALSRFILFAGMFVLLKILILLFIAARGVELSAVDYSALLRNLLPALLMVLFFLFAGMIIGTIRSAVVSVSCIFAVFLVLTIIIPGAMDTSAEENFPGTTMDFQAELDKFKMVSDFEKRSKEKYGEFDRGKIEIERKIVEDYWSNEFKKIKESEDRLMAELKGAVYRSNKLALWTPTTFYLHCCNEVSSKGYENFFKFYDYVKTMWVKFVRFWIDRVFYHDSGEIVSFIKADENIFRSRSCLPPDFSTGLLILLGELVILFFVGLYRFNQWMHPPTKNPEAYDGLVIDFTKKEPTMLHVYLKEFIPQFFNELYGKGRGLKWKITAWGKNLSGPGKKAFFLVPSINQVPGDIKVKDLFTLFKGWFKPSAALIEEVSAAIGEQLLKKYFSSLEGIDKARVLLILSRLVNTPLYILNDFAFGLPKNLWHELPEYVEALAAKNSMIIAVETSNTPWLQTQSQKVIAYINGKYEDYT